MSGGTAINTGLVTQTLRTGEDPDIRVKFGTIPFTSLVNSKWQIGSHVKIFQSCTILSIYKIQRYKTGQQQQPKDNKKIIGPNKEGGIFYPSQVLTFCTSLREKKKKSRQNEGEDHRERHKCAHGVMIEGC